MTKTRIRPTTDVACKPVTCPTCGTTECFERPRYFSGQMLTDRDLDAGQRYVIDKNKLHNRYLVGTGVVCGLAVRCDRCDAGTVVVQPGYAIDCCGDDIVLCGPASFSVADWLHACRTKVDECGKIKAATPCDGLEKEYYLLLYYNEEPGKPITSLMRQDGCSNVRCEPSRMKETFRLTLMEKDEYKRTAPPSMWTRIRNCVGGVTDELKKLAAQIADVDKIQDPAAKQVAAMQVFCRWRDYILKIYRLGPNDRCTLVEELRALEEQASHGGNAIGNKQFVSAFIKLIGYAIQYIIDCICDAILVPCAPCDDEGVILACLTVRNEKVIKICNQARTQIVTGPALRYWLQPLYAGVAKIIERFCCELDIIGLFDRPVSNETIAPGAYTPKAMAMDATTETINATRDANANATTDTIGGDSSFDPQSFSAFGTRGSNFFSMTDDIGAAFGSGLDTAAFLPLFSADLLNAVDLYNMPVADATRILAERKVPYNVRTASNDAEAYSIGNIFQMQWIVRSNQPVEVLVNATGHVTAVRSSQQRSQQGGGQ